MVLPTSFVGSLRFHGGDLIRIQRLLDPLIVSFLFLLIGESTISNPLPIPGTMWVFFLTLLILPSASLYLSYRQKSLLTLVRRVSSGWLFVLTTILLLTFLTKTTAYYSRSSIIIWSLTSWSYLLFSHVGLRQLLRLHRIHGGNKRSIVYWGTIEAASAFADQLAQSPWMGLTLQAWFCPLPPLPNSQPSNLPPCSGGISDMRRWLLRHPVDRIVFSHVTRDGVSMEQVLRLFGDTSVPVIYAPHWAHPAMRFTVDSIGEQPCIELWGSEQSLLDRQIKRLFDLLLSSLLLLLLLPFLFLISLAVYTSSPGPVLFVQDRYGLDGRRFSIYKFRTMRVIEPGDQPGLKQATKEDPRVTPLGRILRRWSLDELPQLLNVFKGEMSLVGPRPHAVDHNEQYRRLIPGYMQRHAFKPGITGLAQVEGWRGETKTIEAMARRVDADLRYQRDWSLKLDIKIIIKTILRLRSSNAY
jgi:putative colanic acid biosysnthesis UDP-glucose lipid carrier transferase